ncbi:MAG: class I SAM-dependent methyltransferase [Fusobacteriaceae bacterium]|nr:class I SAM-dependent methyltransferase [Fusobacteriaceae bacterium]
MDVMFPKKIKNKRNEIIDFLILQGLPSELLYNVCLQEDDAISLIKLVKNYKPEKILEVGSYVGVSSVLMKCFSKESILVSVDANLSVKTDAEKYGFDKNIVTSYYFELLKKKFGYTDNIINLSGFYSKTPDIRTINYHRKNNLNIDDIKVIDENELMRYSLFDFIFIDADHYRESVFSDLNHSKKFISDKSVIILHDFVGKWENEVVAGAEMFIRENSEFYKEKFGTLGLIKSSGKDL